jgi:hypothetical protein
MYLVPKGQHDRSLARSAWESVHGEDRPVGHGMIGSRCARLRESDRTLRDGSFGWRCPRHFVPGYDRTVPLGQNHSHIEGLALC